jgi:hypothetical protein
MCTAKKTSPLRSESEIVQSIIDSFPNREECERYCYDKIFYLKIAQDCKPKKQDKIFGSFLIGILHNVLLWVKPPKVEERIDIHKEDVLNGA